MSRHIKLEIFDDAERCESEDRKCMCDYLSWGKCLLFPFNRSLWRNADGERLRCPECKAAEVTIG